MDTRAVTVVGLGLMGQALAGAFLADGRPTTVWNRGAGKAGELVARGAVEAASIEEALSASPLVVVCVRDYDAVHSVLDPVAGSLAGRVLVNLTSGSSGQARAMGAWAAGHGAAYLDGAIMMTPPGIGQPGTVILYSGEHAVFTAHEPTLRLLGGRPTHLGDDAGLASLYDVALLGLMWGTFNSFLHGAALLETEGVTATEFLPFATDWLGGVATFLGLYAQQIDAGEFAASDATLETQVPPVGHLLHESRARGVAAGPAEYTQSLIEAAVSRGHGADSYARIIDHFRAAARPEPGRA
jgi:3-hydroxyisobutyrate dehydrogenase-like beta-hydroxyacid dehydrogenase